MSFTLAFVDTMEAETNSIHFLLYHAAYNNYLRHVAIHQNFVNQFRAIFQNLATCPTGRILSLSSTKIVQNMDINRIVSKLLSKYRLCQIARTDVFSTHVILKF